MLEGNNFTAIYSLFCILLLLSRTMYVSWTHMKELTFEENILRYDSHLNAELTKLPALNYYSNAFIFMLLYMRVTIQCLPVAQMTQFYP